MVFLIPCCVPCLITGQLGVARARSLQIPQSIGPSLHFQVSALQSRAKPPLTLPRVDTVSYPSVSLPSGSSSGKSKAPLKTLSNPSQALAHLQKHQTHLAGLPAEKRAEIEERERWAKAEERAAGGKVADNEKVLKNAVKRMEKAKAKGGKEW
jgi:hypothetical protein